MKLIERALLQCAEPFRAAPRIWVAYSGGVDSHVLLHALARQQFLVTAVHIHHGLQAVADQWVTHCQEQAQQLGVPIEIIKVSAHPVVGQSPEQAARHARYTAIQSLLAPNDLVLTAHNQDDQAETLLLQLFRGAGPKGLAAMPKLTSFGVGELCRPLLSVTRADIESYAQSEKLHWIEDPTNRNTHYDRNFLRNTIMPLLKQRWPTLAQTIARSAEHQADASQLQTDLAEFDSINVQGSQQKTVSVSAILQFPKVRQGNVLRYWIHQQGLPTPSTQQLKILLTDVLHAAPDKNPLLSWTGAEVRRFRDDLYAMKPLQPFDSSIVIPWDRLSPLAIPQIGVLDPDHPSLPENREPVIVRFRQGSERCRLPHRQGSHTLKHLLQELDVPPWLRDRIPLIYLGDELVSIYHDP